MNRSKMILPHHFSEVKNEPAIPRKLEVGWSPPPKKSMLWGERFSEMGVNPHHLGIHNQDPQPVGVLQCLQERHITTSLPQTLPPPGSFPMTK
ncbi:hypothetical protein NPIL_385391 [Nephila pilipes]|uniref:Uncharacterized protein n=1 Tax=Nephila pilipes TaxID=299642 RepID=A0A8X6QH30_NEPPI|nr:hypothetical protein NPIL_385391 [Nephila pilipes]